MRTRLIVLANDPTALRLAREFAHPTLSGDRCSRYTASSFSDDHPTLMARIDVGDCLDLPEPSFVLFSGNVVRHERSWQEGRILSNCCVEVIVVRSVRELEQFNTEGTLFVRTGTVHGGKSVSFTREKMYGDVRSVPGNIRICQFRKDLALRQLVSVLYGTYFSLEG